MFSVFKCIRVYLCVSVYVPAPLELIMHVCVCAFPGRLRAKPKRFDVVGGILPGLIRSGTVFSYNLKMGDWARKTIFRL